MEPVSQKMRIRIKSTFIFDIIFVLVIIFDMLVNLEKTYEFSI